ncbi:MAG TPA: metallophosphoesterase [Clostridia bacterium]|mgnify:CR=1 FL=1|nr:metallophosphoesterase [Clostridia bacterium]HPQ47268.1 metallophosphoesterase [Clostridia bacterium]
MKRGRRKVRTSTKVIGSLILVVLLLLGYSFIEPYWLKVTEYEISSPGIPAEFDGYEILFVSDIHHGPYFSVERVEKLRDRMNSMGADLILLGGDYVHRGPLYVPEVFSALKGLSAPDGVMGVLGNHDHWDGEQATRDGFAYAGITDIENIGVTVQRDGASIEIAGVGDYDMGVQELNLDPRLFSILVSHNPDYIAGISGVKPDLMLSGHTHGGQVTLFGLWAPLIPSAYWNKFRYGEIDYNDIRLIVTSGVGTITPPMRFFARPEIVRITLRSGNGS